MSKKQVSNTPPAKPAGMKKLEHRGPLRRGASMNSRNGPCKDCPDRCTACSDHCKKPEYIAWKEERAKIREARQRESSIRGYTANEISKNRRNSHR